MMAAAVVVFIATLLQCDHIFPSSSSFVADAFSPYVNNNNYHVNANDNNNANNAVLSSRRHRCYSPTPVDVRLLLSPSSSCSSGAARRTMTSFITRLSMAAKSGGRLILTAEQFEREVLRPPSAPSAPSHSPRQQQHSSSTSTSSVGDNVVPDVGVHADGAGDHINHNTNSNSDDNNNNNNNNNNNILPVLVLFTAPWCGPCRLTSPVVTEIMTQYVDKIRVLEISTDDLPDVAITAGVRSIPTILLYHEGVVQDIIVGCVAKNVLAHAVDKMLEELEKKKSRKH